ncbi:MAG: hypothetical protein DRH24_13525 [Deltaproteobacteria bacterium]|nr:MAG: hypothetical protein DRH24_13525 [Deltaproteobacteria bacterium]
MLKVMGIIRRVRPDIVHTHNFLAHVNAAPAAKLLRKAVVHTKHGRAVTSISWAPFIRRWLYNLSDKIVVVSKETGVSFREKTGVSERRIKVVYNGVDTSVFEGYSKGEAKKSLGIPEDTVVFGAVSRLDRVKDHITMVDAFADVLSKGKECLLMIVGDGPERENIERRVQELGISDHVRMVGFTDEVPGHLAAMDLFLQPSREEGLSITILEAMASGVPVVATPVGGTPEMIEDGVTGRLVAIGDSRMLSSVMIEFLEEPQKFSLMAERALKRVKESFTLSTMANEYEKIYREVLSSHRIG